MASKHTNHGCLYRCDETFNEMASTTNYVPYSGRIMTIFMILMGIMLSVLSISSCSFVSRSNASFTEIGLFRYRADFASTQCINHDFQYIKLMDPKHDDARAYSICAPVMAFVVVITSLLDCSHRRRSLYVHILSIVLLFLASIAQGLTLLLLQSDIICDDAFDCKISGGALLSVAALIFYASTGFGLLVLPRPKPISLNKKEKPQASLHKSIAASAKQQQQQQQQPPAKKDDPEVNHEPIPLTRITISDLTVGSYLVGSYFKPSDSSISSEEREIETGNNQQKQAAAIDSNFSRPATPATPATPSFPSSSQQQQQRPNEPDVLLRFRPGQGVIDPPDPSNKSIYGQQQELHHINNSISNAHYYPESAGRVSPPHFRALFDGTVLESNASTSTGNLSLSPSFEEEP